MKKYGQPRSVVTDGLCLYPAAMKEIGNADRHEVGRRLNNRAENSHQPFRRREGAMQLFRSAKTLQKFNSRAGPQSFQPGASSRDPRGLQTATLGHAGRVARPRGLATDGLSACHAIRRPRVVTMTKPAWGLPLLKFLTRPASRRARSTSEGDGRGDCAHIRVRTRQSSGKSSISNMRLR
jgi:hypothetical protein